LALSKNIEELMDARHGSVSMPEHTIHVDDQSPQFSEFLKIIGAYRLHLDLASYGVLKFGWTDTKTFYTEKVMLHSIDGNVHKREQPWIDPNCH
jgi:hypothetical protein